MSAFAWALTYIGAATVSYLLLSVYVAAGQTGQAGEVNNGRERRCGTC